LTVHLCAVAADNANVFGGASVATDYDCDALGRQWCSAGAFSPTDLLTAPHVAVVSESLAR
jgi:hypothetical protein